MRWVLFPLAVVCILIYGIVSLILNKVTQAAAPPPTTATPTATTAPPPQKVLVRQGYDFISCTHDPKSVSGIPCTPLFAWPLTETAKYIIGWETGEGVTAEGELSTANTRAVYIAVRKLPRGVDDCTLYIDSKLALYAGQGKAPQDSTKLLNCAGNAAGTTVGSIPTATP